MGVVLSLAMACCGQEASRPQQSRTEQKTTSTTTDSLNVSVESLSELIAAAGGSGRIVRPQSGAAPLDLSATRRLGEWSLEARSSDNAYFLIDVPSGECRKLVAIRVIETERSVTVAPILKTPRPGTPCVPSLVVEKYLIALASPLGDRRLLHLTQD